MIIQFNKDKYVNQLIPFLLAVFLSLAIFGNFYLSPKTLIYLDSRPTIYPLKFIPLIFNRTFNSYGAIVLLFVPKAFFVHILSLLFGIYNAYEILWLVPYIVSAYFTYKVFEKLKLDNWYVAVIILLFNTFLYLRITSAGQIGVALASTLFPLMLYFLLEFYESPNWKNAFLLALAITLPATYSVHYLILNSFILLVYTVIRIYLDKKVERKHLLPIIALILVNLPWLILLPVLKPTLVKFVNYQHIEFFAPKGYYYINELVKLTGLYGFWREVAVKRFYIEYPYLYLFYVFLFIFLTILGFLNLKEKRKDLAYLFLALFFLGLSLPLILEHFPNFFFSKVFRDSHKLAYFILIAYAFLFPSALTMENKKLQKVIALIFIALWFFYNKYLFLLDNQLHPIQYPSFYFEADKALQKSYKGGNILYLPWGIYFTYNWSLKAGLDGRLANVANAVFKEVIITGCNPQGDFCALTKYQYKILKCLENKSIECLRESNISYVILDKSVLLPVEKMYNWLLNNTTIIYNNSNIVIVYLR